MIPYFINPHSFAIAVPNAMGSTTVVPPGGLVKGTYYTALSLIGLLAEYNGVVDPLNVYYTYPEGSGSGSPGSGITSIVAGTGILVDTVGTEATISLNPGSITASYIQDGSLTANKITAGQVVKSLNTYTDKVQINFNAGITAVETPSLDPDVATTIDVSVDAPGLTSTNATLPLSLSLGLGNQQLNGSISITPTNDGGAIAKQATLPVTYQTGHVGLTGNIYNTDGFLRFNSSEDTDTVIADPFARILSFGNSNYEYFFAVVNKDGGIFVDPAYNLVASLSDSGYLSVSGLSAYSSSNFLAGDGKDIVYIGSEATQAASAVDIYGLTTFYNTAALDDVSLVSTVNSVSPIDILTTSLSIPAILVSNETNTNSAIAFQTRDNIAAITSQLDTNGNLFVNSVETTGIITTPVFLPAGSYNLSLYTEQVFIIDSTSSATTIELPELTVGGTVKSGTIYTIAKYDATANGILIAPSNGQQINGQTNITLTEQGQSANIMAVVQSSPSPATFWITVGRA